MSEYNLITLWENALPPDKIPTYPSYTLTKAKSGDKTYELAKNKNGFGYVKERLAIEGELLRDVDLKYIPDITENLKFRIDVKQKCDRSKEYCELQKVFCKSSILYFVNTFCWTYDPRLLPNEPTVPFITFPAQDDLITWVLWLIKVHQDGLIEKSRDMGATWCMQAVWAYMALFYQSSTLYELSLGENDVDNRKPNSLLGKYRLLLRNLPEWMRCGWVEKEQGIDAKMIISCPESGSDVIGQLTGGTAGRSGRATAALFDEFAFIEDSEKVLDANSSLANTNLYLSTPNGMGNAFYRMASDPKVRKKSLHWSQHFLKNEQWVLKERFNPKYTDERWAQEHEINYERSTIGRVYPEFVSFSSSEYNWSHVHEGEYFEYDPNYDVYLGMDFGMADPTSLVWAQLKPTLPLFKNSTKLCLVIFDEYEEGNKTVDFWANLIKERSYRYRFYIGDFRTANQRDSTGNTWKNYLAHHGIPLVGKYSSEEKTLLGMKSILSIPGALALNRKNCPNTIKGFQNWSFPLDKDGYVVHSSSPKHDRWSHNMKAMLYLIDYMQDPPSGSRRSIDKWDFKVISNVGV